jgi:hypothetical protein
MPENKIGVTIDHMKLRKEIKYESWKYKYREHISSMFFIFKRWFMNILDLSEKDWYNPETKEMFCKYIYKRKGVM